MKWLRNKKLSVWIRVIHRDLGFLAVGLCLVYGISGYLLNHMNGKDPAFKTEERTLKLGSGLTAETLPLQWNNRQDVPALKKVMPIDEEHFRLLLDGGIGVYHSVTGMVDYEKHRKNEFIYQINKLHYNKAEGWSPVADFFVASLLFLAISGLFMVKGKKGIAGRGKWYLIAGLLIPVIYIIINR